MTDTKAGMKCSYRTESVLCCIEMRPALKIKYTLEQSHFRALPPEAFVSVNIISFCVMTQQNESRVGLTESHLAKSSNNHICVQKREWNSSTRSHFYKVKALFMFYRFNNVFTGANITRSCSTFRTY